jgi:hypothetical protein
MGVTASLSLPKLSLLYNLEEKNLRAERIIQDYAAKAALMGIGVGLASWIPGAAIPAILASLAIQKTQIYQPMARDLAALYRKDTDSYTDKLVNVASISTTGIEFASEFALEFLSDQAQELIWDAGLGAAASFIPFAGVAIGAGLDYAISQMLTWRVGTMTSIYFQNGGEWVGDRKQTLNIAKDLTGSITSFKGKSDSARNVRVNLNEIPSKVPKVRDSGVQSILPLLKGLADKLPPPVVRESLIAMGLSAILVDSAIHLYYA